MSTRIFSQKRVINPQIKKLFSRRPERSTLRINGRAGSSAAAAAEAAGVEFSNAENIFKTQNKVFMRRKKDVNYKNFDVMCKELQKNGLQIINVEEKDFTQDEYMFLLKIAVQRNGGAICLCPEKHREKNEVLLLALTSLTNNREGQLVAFYYCSLAIMNEHVLRHFFKIFLFVHPNLTYTNLQEANCHMYNISENETDKFRVLRGKYVAFHNK